MGRSKSRPRDPRQLQGELLSLEVRQRPQLEDPILSGALKLKGELPCKRDLNPGDLITVTVADADGTVFSTGIFEATVPTWKEIRIPQVGPIGLERVNAAVFDKEA